MPNAQRPRLDRESAWIWAAVGVALLAALARLHNAFAYPPLDDFDGAGHALYVFALREGQLPRLGSWLGFHPPLYYAAGALLWRVLPEAVPVHAALRLLSAAAGFGAVALALRALAPLFPRADLAVVGALLLGTPVFAIATSMLGNETTCALLVTAVLARLARLPSARAPALQHAFGTGILAGSAALAKSTALGAVGVAALAYALRLRRAAPAALLAGGIVLATSALLAGPFYLYLVGAAGSPLAVVSGGALSEELRREMALQPPGERHLGDYLRVPAATLLAPSKDAPGMLVSVPGLLYASTWADGHGQFLPAEPRVLRASALCALAGLLPTALGLLGAARVLREWRRFAALAPALLFALLLGGAFLVQTWLVPVYSAVKASYLLSALLAAATLLAAGLTRFEGSARELLRGALLAVACSGIALTWYGWWS